MNFSWFFGLNKKTAELTELKNEIERLNLKLKLANDVCAYLAKEYKEDKWGKYCKKNTKGHSNG